MVVSIEVSDTNSFIKLKEVIDSLRLPFKTKGKIVEPKRDKKAEMEVIADIFGSWEDDRTAEEIIKEIYESRTGFTGNRFWERTENEEESKGILNLNRNWGNEEVSKEAVRKMIEARISRTSPEEILLSKERLEKAAGSWKIGDDEEDLAEMLMSARNDNPTEIEL